LENYCWSDDLMNAARVMFSATILLTYPFECFVAREVLKNTILCNSPDTTVQHVGISVLLVLVTLLLSMTTDCLGIVLELNVSQIPSQFFPMRSKINVRRFSAEKSFKIYEKEKRKSLFSPYFLLI